MAKSDTEREALHIMLCYLTAQVTSRVQTCLAYRPESLAATWVHRGTFQKGATDPDPNFVAPDRDICLLVMKIESRTDVCSRCLYSQGREGEGQEEAVLPKMCSRERCVLNAAGEAWCKDMAHSFSFSCVPGQWLYTCIGNKHKERNPYSHHQFLFLMGKV